MPKGTRVHRCVDEVKNSRRKVNPYAVCQASTKQSFATGKKLKESIAHTGYKRIGIALAETMGLVDEGILRKTATKLYNLYLGGGGADPKAKARNDKFKAEGEEAGKDIAKKIKQEVANEQEEPLMKWKNKVLELVIEGNKKSKALGQEAGKDLAIARGIDITTEEGLRKYKKLRAKALKNIVQGHQEVHGTRQQDKVS